MKCRVCKKKVTNAEIHCYTEGVETDHGFIHIVHSCTGCGCVFGSILTVASLTPSNKDTEETCKKILGLPAS